MIHRQGAKDAKKGIGDEEQGGKGAGQREWGK